MELRHHQPTFGVMSISLQPEISSSTSPLHGSLWTTLLFLFDPRRDLGLQHSIDPIIFYFLPKTRFRFPTNILLTRGRDSYEWSIKALGPLKIICGATCTIKELEEIHVFNFIVWDKFIVNKVAVKHPKK